MALPGGRNMLKGPRQLEPSGPHPGLPGLHLWLLPADPGPNSSQFPSPDTWQFRDQVWLRDVDSSLPEARAGNFGWAAVSSAARWAAEAWSPARGRPR